MTGAKVITIVGNNTQEIDQIGNLLNQTIQVVHKDDLIKLLTAVVKKPGVVKTALKWI